MESVRFDSINVDALLFPFGIVTIKKDMVYEQHKKDIYQQIINECKKEGKSPSHRMKVNLCATGQGRGINLLQYIRDLERIGNLR